MQYRGSFIGLLKIFISLDKKHPLVIVACLRLRVPTGPGKSWKVMENDDNVMEFLQLH